MGNQQLNTAVADKFRYARNKIATAIQTKPIKCLLLGKRNSGKTTIVNVLRLGCHVRPKPTLEHMYTSVKVNGQVYDFLDLPGEFEMWQEFYATYPEKIIFCVKVRESEDEIVKMIDTLLELLSEPMLRDCPVLLLGTHCTAIDKESECARLANIVGVDTRIKIACLDSPTEKKLLYKALSQF